MRTPRDHNGARLIRGLGKLGYEPTRQSGNHVRLTRPSAEGDDHVIIPLHDPLRIGTLNVILGDVAQDLGLSKEDVIRTVS